jgi:hypothetical protein
MRTAAQAHRSNWLRRTRRVTGWIAAIATAATLLIAAVAGSASPPKRVAKLVRVPARQPPSVLLSAARPAQRHRHRTHIRTHHRKPAVVKPHVTAPAKPPPPPPPPAPAPPVAPVAVSGGS